MKNITYRKMKNILGVSLMSLAVLISQIPMPQSQAEQQMISETVNTVTFNMNGGAFNGTYNDFSFNNQSPVIVLEDNEKINNFPLDKYVTYKGYKTEKDTWYTEKECIEIFDKESKITDSITLYKKWYNITSDGEKTATKGFYMNPDQTVLYKYDGNEKLVIIPDTVEFIAKDAFGNIGDEVRGISLPESIEEVHEEAFSGADKGENIIYVYDADTKKSEDIGKNLDDKYEQLVHSVYLDVDDVEKIAGIDFGEDVSNNKEDSKTEESSKVEESSKTEESSKSEESSKTEENSKVEESSKTEESSKVEESSKTEESSKSEESSKTEESSKVEESSKTEESSKSEESSKTEESSKSEESSKTEESSKVEESTKTEETSESSVIVVDLDEEFTVTFDTCISNIAGEKRTVLKGRTISEMVSVNDMQPVKLKKGEYKIEKDDGTKEITYVFQGWYKDSEYKTAWDFANDVVESNTTIYAKWDTTNKAYFFVKFTAEGAENVPESIKVYEDEKLEKPEKEPKIKDKEFKGWYTDAKDSSKKYTDWGKKITSNLELFAQWEDKGYTVTFDMNGGAFTGNYDGTEYNGVSKVKNKIAIGKGIINSEYPEKDTSATIKYGSYTTDSNWYTDKECLSVYNKTDSNGNNTILSKDITLYKKWYYTKSGFVLNPEGTVLYKYYGGDKAVVIPDTVVTIAKNAFADVTGVESITIHENLTDIREDAFSGAKNITKDIKLLMSKDTEKAKSVAKEINNKYSHLVYQEAVATNNDVVVKETSESDKSSVVTVAESGSIKVGAEIKTEASTTVNNSSAQIVNMPSGNVITIGEGASTVNNTNKQEVAVNNVSAGNVANSTTVGNNVQNNAANSFANNTVKSNNTTVKNGQTAVTQKNSTSSTASASAPRSTQHIKDSTPKTGDATQYRMILVYALFSAGVLLLLTGNGNKKKAVSS